MELTFADEYIRSLCLNEFLAKRELGDPIAEKLKTRLADIASVTVAAELFCLPGNARELTGERLGYMVMDLIEGKRLVFLSGHITERLQGSGSVDWSRVRRVKILGLENVHE